jgi:hypothetical protein
VVMRTFYRVKSDSGPAGNKLSRVTVEHRSHGCTAGTSGCLAPAHALATLIQLRGQRSRRSRAVPIIVIPMA